MELIVDPKSGATLDATLTMYPSRLEVHTDACRLTRPCSTSYEFVVRGRAKIASEGLEVSAGEGMYFCIPGELELQVDGLVVCVERIGFRGVAQCGVIEREGRLSYIDGCSDTVLVAPPRLGDPVLNHLHFPAGIVQSVHSHPSIRLGVVARGSGVAYGPGASKAWERELSPGGVFLLSAHELHAFRTNPASGMDVIAFHPDSDWGPTDENHPMRNRTYLRSARGR